MGVGQVWFGMRLCAKRIGNPSHVEPARGHDRNRPMADSHILFVCTDCRLRSPTAAKIYRRRPDLEVDCGGLGDLTKRPVTEEMVEWADIIFVMERRDVERMRGKWPVLVKNKRLINLGVPDEFAYMEGRLVKLLVRRLARYIGEPRKPL